MGLFGKKAGGLMDVIRCDEDDYLIWKWHPEGTLPNTSSRENSIRWGSSLRVKEGSVAVFVYKQNDGKSQDFIEGPYDETLKTGNLPILANIVGLAYNGDSPFQAEVYFINLASVIQVKFGVPFFDVFDPRFLDFAVPMAVRGTLTFKITDYKEFIKLHRLDVFSTADFQRQVRDSIINYVKRVVANVPADFNIPVIQIERKIGEITDAIQPKVADRLMKDFGVTVSGFDISDIEVDKASPGYQQLKSVTQDIAAKTVQAQGDINIQNMQDMQRINAQNMEETLRMQREEAQYAQHKQTQSSNLSAFQIEQQANVGIAGANALGQMGANGAMDMNGGGMNPAGMMTGMAMGGAIGQNMAGMMNGMMNGLNTPNPGTPTPPPVQPISYQIAVNGQATGPYDENQLKGMIGQNTFTKDSLVWKPGMANWVKAETVSELANLFTSVPPVPPMNGVPPVPPAL